MIRFSRIVLLSVLLCNGCALLSTKKTMPTITTVVLPIKQMPKTEFTPAELKAYFTDKKMYHYCLRARDQEREMRVHADGIFPDKLINERRPNEPETVLEYRKKIFVAKTKPYFGKIENTLQKIRRSSDWSIKYPDVSFDKIVEGEKMNDYAEEQYPIFTSVTNWAFSLLLRNYLVDANALVLVGPTELPEAETQFLKPIATIFNSCDVIDYVPDDYAVMINKTGCVYYSQGQPKLGKSFYIVTTEYISRHDQVNGRGEYAEAFKYDHGLELLPVFKLGGIVIDVYGSSTLYESRISGVLPEFNEALREYSDLQAAKVLHLYPERWEYTQNECLKCKGTGERVQVVNNEQCQVTCDTCGGQGYIASGPYSKMLLRPASADQLQLPTPPAGFVEKDVEIIKVMDESVDKHIYKALRAINFEFLAQSPLAQSGVAKEVDKDELNNTVNSIAEDIVAAMDNIYWFIALYRYSVLYSKEDIANMVPSITVPEKFDMLSSDHLQEELKKAKDSKFNPTILNAMETEYASKKFNTSDEVSEMVQLILKLDPLPNVTEDDKMSRLSNKGITKETYIISSNIHPSLC